MVAAIFNNWNGIFHLGFPGIGMCCYLWTLFEDHTLGLPPSDLCPWPFTLLFHLPTLYSRTLAREPEPELSTSLSLSLLGSCRYLSKREMICYSNEMRPSMVVTVAKSHLVVAVFLDGPDGHASITLLTITPSQRTSVRPVRSGPVNVSYTYCSYADRGVSVGEGAVRCAWPLNVHPSLPLASLTLGKSPRYSKGEGRSVPFLIYFINRNLNKSESFIVLYFLKTKLKENYLICRDTKVSEPRTGYLTFVITCLSFWFCFDLLSLLLSLSLSPRESRSLSLRGSSLLATTANLVSIWLCFGFWFAPQAPFTHRPTTPWSTPPPCFVVCARVCVRVGDLASSLASLCHARRAISLGALLFSCSPSRWRPPNSRLPTTSPSHSQLSQLAAGPIKAGRTRRASFIWVSRFVVPATWSFGSGENIYPNLEKINSQAQL